VFAATGGATALFASKLDKLDRARPGSGNERIELPKETETAQQRDQCEKRGAMPVFDAGDGLACNAGDGGKLCLGEILIEAMQLEPVTQLALPLLVGFIKSYHNESLSAQKFKKVNLGVFNYSLKQDMQ
jgi:hypothetical protein